MTHTDETKLNRARILDSAKDCICKDRENEYGSPEDNFDMIAQLWTTYKHDTVFTALDVAIMMTLLKIARIRTGRQSEDSFVDACGYIACGAEIAGCEREKVDARRIKNSGSAI